MTVDLPTVLAEVERLQVADGDVILLRGKPDEALVDGLAEWLAEHRPRCIVVVLDPDGPVADMSAFDEAQMRDAGWVRA